MSAVFTFSVALLVTSAAVAQPPPGGDLLRQANAHLAARRFATAGSLLDSIVTQQPANASAWLSLGSARRGLGRTDDAAVAFLKAFAIGAYIPAARSLLLLYANAKRLNDAAPWFDRLRQLGAPDLTSLLLMPEIANLRGDSRFALLFPDSAVFRRPFVEDVTIIHEWRGEQPGDAFGWIGRPLGDVDRDGAADVVISAPQTFGAGAGRVYLYSGKTGRLLWKKDGDPGSGLGTGLESAGDTDRDGIADVIAGAPGLNTVLVLSGRDGKELLRLRGDSGDTGLGASVGGVGDIDGDGHSDIIAGCPNRAEKGPRTGRIYLFSGRDGTRLLTLDGEQSGDRFGSSVSGRHGRFIVGAAGAGPDRRGRIYVYDRLSNLPALVMEADATGSALGAMFTSIIGDVDADGFPEIYASDYTNTANGPGTGRVYLYSGRSGETLLTITGDTPGEGFGVGGAYAGDVNGDRGDDLVVGSWQYPGAAWSGGRVRVLSGKDGRVLRTITGRVPGETLGFDAVGVGDVDADSIPDYLLTSAWSMVHGLRSGRAYIISGKETGAAGPPE